MTETLFDSGQEFYDVAHMQWFDPLVLDDRIHVLYILQTHVVEGNISVEQAHEAYEIFNQEVV